MKINKIRLSKIASAVVVSTVIFTGCNFGSSSAIPSTSTTVSGTVIDGYIKNAKVTFGGKEATTDENGKYTFTFATAPAAGALVASGGIDTDTGEVFEGVLKAPMAAGATVAAITPLTTLVQSAVDSGKTLAEAKTNIAVQLGIDEATLVADPIAQLLTGDATAKAAAAVAIKQALKVQKTVELYAKAAGGDVNANFVDIMKAVAASLVNLGSTQSATALATATAATVVSAAITDTTAQANIVAVEKSVKAVQSVMEAMVITADTTVAEIATKAKAIEVVTSKVEAVVEAAVAGTGSIADAEDTVKAVVMLGGVEKIAAQITVAQAAAVVASKTVDTSSFADIFLDATVVAAQKTVFETNFGTDIADSDINIETIAAVISGTDTTTTTLTKADGSILDATETTNIVAATESAVTAIDTTAAAKTAEETAAAEAADLVASAKLVDMLALKDSQVTIGDQLVTIEDGSFGNVKHDIVEAADVAALYSANFSLTNILDADENAYASMENGDVKSLTLGIKIENNDNAQALLVVMDKVKLTRGGTIDQDLYDGAYSVEVEAGAKLYGYGTKSDGSYITAELTNDSANGSVSTDATGAIDIDLSSTIAKFEAEATGELGTVAANLKSYFGENGSYKVSLYISGTSGISEATPATGIATGLTDAGTQISGVAATAVTSKFSGLVSQLTGTVIIGMTEAEILAANTTSVDAIAAQVTSRTVPTQLDGVSVAFDKVALVASVEDQTQTVTATISKGSGTTAYSTTTTFTETLAADQALIDAADQALIDAADLVTVGAAKTAFDALASGERSFTHTGVTVEFSAEIATATASEQSDVITVTFTKGTQEVTTTFTEVVAASQAVIDAADLVTVGAAKTAFDALASGQRSFTHTGVTVTFDPASANVATSTEQTYTVTTTFAKGTQEVTTTFSETVAAAAAALDTGLSLVLNASDASADTSITVATDHTLKVMIADADIIAAANLNGLSTPRSVLLNVNGSAAPLVKIPVEYSTSGTTVSFVLFNSLGVAIAKEIHQLDNATSLLNLTSSINLTTN